MSRLRLSRRGGQASASRVSLTNRERLGISMPRAPYGDTADDFSTAISATSAGFIRADFAGSVIRPSSSTWNWSLADTVVERAIASGVKVLAQCTYCHDWMNGGHSNDKFPPTTPNFSNYAAIAAEVESRYGSNLIGIETWNEPWLTSDAVNGAFWLPEMEPDRFLALSIAQAEAVWAINPNRDIAVSLDYWGQGVNNGQRFDSAVVSYDTTDFLLDPRVVLTVHNYCQNSAPQDVRSLGWSFDRWKLARTAAGNQRVWVTEYGWSTPGDATEAEQATYIADGINMMLDDGVERMVVFTVSQASDTTGYNLRRPNGTWRPAAAAFKAIAEL